MVNPKLIVDLTNENKECTKCRFLSTDCWYNSAWWICTHEKFEDTELGSMDLEISINDKPIKPSWCPLEKR